MRDVPLAKYYQVSNKLNHMDKVNKFKALPGDLVSCSRDTLTEFLRSESKYAKIAQKLEKIFGNNKAWSTIKLDTGRNTFQCKLQTIQSQMKFGKRWLK